MKRTKLRKVSKDEARKMQKKVDALLTPIVKITTPRCEACGHETEVAHHWIEKSRSTYLRYDFRNLIALCHSCHAKIHNRFGNSVMGSLDVANLIIERRGARWFKEIVRDSVKIVKADLAYFTGHFERLSALLKEMR